MIRRLLLPLLALGVSVVAVGGWASPAAATGWTLFNHPGNSWGYAYVEDDANPQWCIGLGSKGDASIDWSYMYVILENDAGTILAHIRDRFPNAQNVCGAIPAGATRARVGLYAAGGPSGLHHGWSYVFAYEDWAVFHPWACFGCWGQPPV